MPVPRGTKYRIKTYPLGKRVRLAIYDGKIIETKSMPRAKITKTKRRLQRRKRRIGLR